MEHSFERMFEKANKIPYCLKRNDAYNIKTFVKLGYKSNLLPILTLRKNVKMLELFQRKGIKLVCGNCTQGYNEQLRLLNILPLTLILRINNLLLSKLHTENTITERYLQSQA